MNITKVSVSRKFNLGNYESLDMAMEAEINDTENPNDVLIALRDNIEMQFINQKTTKRPTQPPPTPQPVAKDKPQGDTSRQGDVCPNCGGKKKPGFNQCYNCYEAEKAD